ALFPARKRRFGMTYYCDELKRVFSTLVVDHLAQRLGLAVVVRSSSGDICWVRKKKPHTNARATMMTAGLSRVAVKSYNHEQGRSRNTTVSKPPSAGASTYQQQHASRYGGGQYGWTSSS